MLHRLPAFAPELPYVALKAFVLDGRLIAPGDQVSGPPHLMRQLYRSRRTEPDYSGTRFVASRSLLLAGKRYKAGDILPELLPHETQQFLNLRMIRARPKGRGKE